MPFFHKGFDLLLEILQCRVWAETHTGLLWGCLMCSLLRHVLRSLYRWLPPSPSLKPYEIKNGIGGSFLKASPCQLLLNGWKTKRRTLCVLWDTLYLFRTLVISPLHCALRLRTFRYCPHLGAFYSSFAMALQPTRPSMLWAYRLLFGGSF